MEYIELSQKASELRKKGLYADALACYEELTFEFAGQCTSWDYWGHAYCLLKLGKWREAETFCRSYREKEESFQLIDNVLAWSLYYQYIKGAEAADTKVLTGYAGEILALCRKDDKYSPYTAVIFQVLEALSKKFPYPAETILQWAGLLDAGSLDENTAEMNRPDGKKIELASRREQYYMILTRALYECARYEECAEKCDQALSRLTAFHYDNDVWFRRRKALCLFYMGNAEEAIEAMRGVFARKKDWFVRFELGEMLINSGNKDEGASLLASAALERGDPEKKLKLYAALARWYDNNGEHETAMAHYTLIWQLRIAQGWKEDEEIRIRLENERIDLCALPPAEEIIQRLMPQWEELANSKREKLQGVIQKVLPNGKAGFIVTVDGRTYYFELRNFKGKREEASPGCRVKFFLEDGYDARKQRNVKNAVQVMPVKNS